MDRRNYILTRIHRELSPWFTQEPPIYQEEESSLHLLCATNADNGDFYYLKLSWTVDDENDQIIFRSERMDEKVFELNTTKLLRFCNEWNKKWLHGTAFYDKKSGGLYLDYTLPLPERVSDMFLAMQICDKMIFAAESFFKDAEKFKWITPKN